VAQTLQNNLCSAGTTLSMEYLSRSAVMPSDPADFPFFSFPTALATSSTVGASVLTLFSLGVKAQSLSIPSCGPAVG